jgi:hypothetical protein
VVNGKNKPSPQLYIGEVKTIRIALGTGPERSEMVKRPDGPPPGPTHVASQLQSRVELSKQLESSTTTYSKARVTLFYKKQSRERTLAEAPIMYLNS